MSFEVSFPTSAALMNNTLASEKEKKQDPLTLVPGEIALRIFSYLLPFEELRLCCLVKKAWKCLACDKTLWTDFIYKKIAFGKEKWAIYLGEIGKEPPLPENIYEILKSPCPFFKDKIVAQTHVLVVIPKEVNQKPLNIVNFEKLVLSSKKSPFAYYHYAWHAAIKELGLNPIEQEESYWILMTKEILPRSKNKSNLCKQASFNELAEPIKEGYKLLPKALEAFVAIFTTHLHSGTYLFNTKPWTYLKCEEKIRDCSLMIGGFSEQGIFFQACHNNSQDCAGFVAVRRLNNSA